MPGNPNGLYPSVNYDIAQVVVDEGNTDGLTPSSTRGSILEVALCKKQLAKGTIISPPYLLISIPISTGISQEACIVAVWF